MTDGVPVNSGNSLGTLQDRRPVADIVNEYEDKKRARRHLQRIIAEMLVDQDNKTNRTGARLAWCGRRPVPAKRFMSGRSQGTEKKAVMVYEPKTDRLYLKNMMTCNLTWACPVCADRLTNKRRRELSEVLSNWRGSVIMGAFTVGHHAGDPLGETKKIIDGACRSLFSGRDGQAVKRDTGIVGTVQANEVIWSPDNGWHPHRHVLFVADRVLTEKDLAVFTEHITRRFKALVTKNKGYTGDHAVHLTIGRDRSELSDYFFKWGVADELLAFQEKTGKEKNRFTPFELADLFGVTGNQRYKILFREYLDVFRGSRRATYSRGLKALLGIAEKTDQALLAEVEAVQIVPAELLPVDADVVQVVADFTAQAVKFISNADQWDVVMDVFKRSIHKELTLTQVGIALAFIGVRVTCYWNGVIAVFTEGDTAPIPSPEVMCQIQRLEIYRT